jgi:hypothetical protein
MSTTVNQQIYYSPFRDFILWENRSRNQNHYRGGNTKVKYEAAHLGGEIIGGRIAKSGIQESFVEDASIVLNRRHPSVNKGQGGDGQPNIHIVRELRLGGVVHLNHRWVAFVLNPNAHAT